MDRNKVLDFVYQVLSVLCFLLILRGGASKTEKQKRQLLVLVIVLFVVSFYLGNYLGAGIWVFLGLFFLPPYDPDPLQPPPPPPKQAKK
jgi:hypothetical protein